MKQSKNSSLKMTQISISLPQELIKQIDKMARLDNRNRSNFIANALSQIAKERLGN